LDIVVLLPKEDLLPPMSERRTTKVGFDMGGQFVVSHESSKEETSMRDMVILKNDPRAEQQMSSPELSQR
jgi:hypothetical protein